MLLFPLLRPAARASCNPRKQITQRFCNFRAPRTQMITNEYCGGEESSNVFQSCKPRPTHNDVRFFWIGKYDPATNGHAPLALRCTTLATRFNGHIQRTICPRNVSNHAPRHKRAACLSASISPYRCRALRPSLARLSRCIVDFAREHELL